MVLWELLTSRRCFLGAEPAEIVRRISADPIPPPSSVRPCSPALDAIVVRALERDADLRFASAREMALALEKSGSIADPRTVARWVRRLARARLEDKSRMVDEMEAELRLDPPSDPAGAGGGGALVAKQTVTVTEAVPRPRRRRVVGAVVSVAAVAIAVVLGTARLARSPRADVGSSSPVVDATTGGSSMPAMPAMPATPATPVAAETMLVAGGERPPEAAPPEAAMPASSARGRSLSKTKPRPAARASTGAPASRPPVDPLGMDERQ
jgi:serine/threonine-protein kinase